MMNKTTALKLLVKFALSPMKMGACGRPESEELFRKFLGTEENSGDVVKEIESYFLTIAPNLNAIANTYGIEDPFNPKVVETYIFGHQLVDGKRPNGFENLVGELKQVATPKYLEQLVSVMPDQYVPTHTWFVILSAFAQNYDSFTFQTEVSSCMVSWGTVGSISLKDSTATINKVMLKIQKGKIETFIQEAAVGYDEKLTGIPVLGSKVAIHRNCVFEILTEKQLENLKNYTKLAIEAHNKKAAA